MLQNLKKRTNNKGFTIIEVLIVLAIAGLILLIVFLAVPALQRNSRNSGRKSDIARIGGATVEFMNNNNGKVPKATDKATLLSTAGNLGQYEFDDAGDNELTIVAFSAGAPAPIDKKDEVRIVTGAKCSTNAADPIGTLEKGGSRQIALQWASETAGGGTPGCTEF